MAALCLLTVGCATTYQGLDPKETSKMYYIVESGKSFEQASEDLAEAVKRNGFGVLHIHDLGSTLRSKGISFDQECKIFEVCNPKQASRVLSTDMRMNMALPCRISVYTEGGKTKIGMIRPKQMLAGLSDDPALSEVAEEVEAKTIQMIEEAK
jgi:uncharacterized protein (DUF302 family)